MLDIKRIRDEYENVKLAVESRGKGDFGLGHVPSLDKQRREVIGEMESMRNHQKTVSKEIPKLKKEGKDTTKILDEMKTLSEKIKNREQELKDIETQIENILLGVPNIPCENTPIGNTDQDNKLIRTWGEPTAFDFEINAHWDIGTSLDILDFERGAKVAGARFTVLKNDGARLERALINFMLDMHTQKHGFTEVMTPFMVNREAMVGTGQLPKFEEDMFHVPSKDFFMIPTAEVPVTNLYGGEILDEENLPIKHTAYTPCFRKEAGSAGRDTRGIIRQHQFNKVEMVKFVKSKTSYDELESLTKSAEDVLQALELPYRVVQLCSGDLGFCSAKTYDIEVWMPSYNRYLEISSCSNFEDYQARRSQIRYRDKETSKVHFVHTLNGSGLAVGRTMAAILENFQQADGSVKLPKALWPYMGGKEEIR